MNDRIIGINVARSLAVMGMIVVNFKIAFGQGGDELIKSVLGLLEGKAAAVFVVLAGVGIALMSNSAIKNGDTNKIRKIQIRLAKKSIFLFVVGLLYIPIWEADILHFYGVYMIITLMILRSSDKIIIMLSFFLILIYPLLMLIWNFDIGWDFETFEYGGFWSINGFIRNLFYNGFHPVIPWTSFMLIGFWFGRQDLQNTRFIKKTIWISLLVFFSTLILSKSLISLLSDGSQISITELKTILGTSPMPPLPIYMISGSSIAIFIISLCILTAEKFGKNRLIIALSKTGQLALTFYVAHVIIGMGIVQILNPDKMGNYSIQFSILYALFFSVISVVFAMIWTKHKKHGPLEWLMRKLTD